MGNASKYSIKEEGAAKVSIYLRADEASRLKAHAFKHERSVSWVIQQALAEYLTKYANAATHRDS